MIQTNVLVLEKDEVEEINSHIKEIMTVFDRWLGVKGRVSQIDLRTEKRLIQF